MVERSFYCIKCGEMLARDEANWRMVSFNKKLCFCNNHVVGPRTIFKMRGERRPHYQVMQASRKGLSRGGWIWQRRLIIYGQFDFEEMIPQLLSVLKNKPDPYGQNLFKVQICWHRFRPATKEFSFVRVGQMTGIQFHDA